MRKKPGRGNMVLAIAVVTFVLVVILLVTALPRFADTDSVRRLIDTANDRGYRDAKVLTFHTVSHNAEFYAPGRLLRDETGKQRKLVSVVEIRNELERNGWENVLVLVPIEYAKQLNESSILSSETIADNGEYLIAKVGRSVN